MSPLKFSSAASRSIEGVFLPAPSHQSFPYVRRRKSSLDFLSNSCGLFLALVKVGGNFGLVPQTGIRRETVSGSLKTAGIPVGPASAVAQVSFGECDTRAGLQVSLEFDRALLVVELDDNVRRPRSPIRGVRARAGVMRSKSREDIRGYARVVAARVRAASDDVHEALCSRHGAGGRN